MVQDRILRGEVEHGNRERVRSFADVDALVSDEMPCANVRDAYQCYKQ